MNWMLALLAVLGVSRAHAQEELNEIVVTGMRAEAYAFGSPELVDLELYLMWRARGMKLEAPAVRP